MHKYLVTMVTEVYEDGSWALETGRQVIEAESESEAYWKANGGSGSITGVKEL